MKFMTKEEIAEDTIDRYTLSGQLICAGDITVNGEKLTGVFIEIPREKLTNCRIPFYKIVNIIET
jgi:hypothetical protein